MQEIGHKGDYILETNLSDLDIARVIADKIVTKAEKKDIRVKRIVIDNQDENLDIQVEEVRRLRQKLKSKWSYYDYD